MAEKVLDMFGVASISVLVLTVVALPNWIMRSVVMTVAFSLFIILGLMAVTR